MSDRNFAEQIEYGTYETFYFILRRGFFNRICRLMSPLAMVAAGPRATYTQERAWLAGRDCILVPARVTGAGLYKFQVAMSSVTVLGLLYAARLRMRTCHAVCRPPCLALSTATDAIHNVPSAAAAQHVVCLVNVARCTSACDARLT